MDFFSSVLDQKGLVQYDQKLRDMGFTRAEDFLELVSEKDVNDLAQEAGMPFLHRKKLRNLVNELVSELHHHRHHHP